jgi:hypothetical protein
LVIGCRSLTVQASLSGSRLIDPVMEACSVACRAVCPGCHVPAVLPSLRKASL